MNSLFKKTKDSFGHMYKNATTKTTHIKIYRIPLIFTEEETKRNVHYRQINTQFGVRAKDDYIDPTSKYMYRCPSAICKYHIMNPQNIKDTILRHCEKFHRNNTLTYEYQDNTQTWIQLMYTPNYADL